GHQCSGATPFCVSGACAATCPAPRSMCQQGTLCVDITSDPANCGRCGNSCPATATCKAGACTCPDAGQVACDTSCTTLASDPNNCGQCGRRCQTGEQCLSGQCSCTGPGLQMCGLRCAIIGEDPVACGASCAMCQDSQY